MTAMLSIPTWMLVALGGHVANGAAFVIDKSLMSRSFKRAATYAGIVGLLGVLALVLLPFGVQAPSTQGWVWIILSGSTFILALWAFFGALAKAEASRVVPIVGCIVPVLTLAGTATLLGERLSLEQAAGFLLLVGATVVLAGGKAKSRLTQKAILASAGAGALFALSFVTVKLGYESDGFLTVFTLSRLVGFVTAAILLASDRRAYDEVMNALAPGRTSSPKRKKNARTALTLVIAAQSLGAGGFVLVQYAISLGSAAMVNALQAVQYAFLVLIAFLFAKKAPDLLGEDLTAGTVIRKSIAILVVAAGLWLVV
jgi:drug/metabolite transporter (DMT)-like permease